MARDYYGVLGVSRNATEQELKRAYRKLARELHPDVNPDPEAQEKFREITVAYEILSDPQRRRIVDAGGDPLSSGSGGMGAGGFGFSGGLGDIFEAFFGGSSGRSRGPRGRVQPGADARARVRITLEECATGITKEITVDTAVLCSTCQGAGSASKAQPITCSTCKGQGEVQQLQRSILGQVMTTHLCPDCHGAGVRVVDPCAECEGEGRVLARRTISASIPAGVVTGNQIRLAGQGEVGRGGGAAGDLYIEIVEIEHPVFVRDGANLCINVKVPMVDAALGIAFSLQTILGDEIEINIPSGSQTGSTIILKGHGMPHVHSHHRGNLEVHLDVQIPKKLDPKHIEILESFRDSRDDHITIDGEEKHAASNGVFSRLRNTFSSR